jgi:hypothetical protein
MSVVRHYPEVMGTTDNDKLLAGIESITHPRPIPRGRRPPHLLAISRPRRPLRDLSEIEGWAGQLVDGMASQVARASSAVERG